MRKKTGVIIAVVAAAVIAGGAGVWYFLNNSSSSGDDLVYVQSVSQIMESGIGGGNRYAGVVQAQKSIKVNADSDKTVKEIYVSVGDTVEEGDPLFSYDVEEQEIALEQLKLELEEIESNITEYNEDLTELAKSRDAAPEEDKYEYVTDIQAKQADIKQAEYDKKSKELEIANAEKAMENTEVVSSVAGTVKTVNNPNDSSNESSDSSVVTITQSGNFRVKGKVNEQNYSQLSVGSDVIIRSRVDESLTWNGRIATIDTTNSQSDSSDDDDDSYGESSESSSTSYPFYVDLDDTSGLMIGQHVLIEMDYGQGLTKDGLWLYDSYIAYEEDGTPYVWADEKGKLAKKTIGLGSFDEELSEYEITDGLTEDDMIAFPMSTFYEGITTVTSEDEVDYSASIYTDLYEDDTEWYYDDDTEWEYIEDDEDFDYEDVEEDVDTDDSFDGEDEESDGEDFDGEDEDDYDSGSSASTSSAVTGSISVYEEDEDDYDEDDYEDYDYDDFDEDEDE